MGNCCGRYRAKNGQIVLLLVGLDNSGKTTVAKGLCGDFVDSTIPTVGFSVVKMSPFRGYDVAVYDLGGGRQIRAIWSSYFHDAHGVIFVVDASDFRRFQESRDALKTLLLDKKLAGKPVLVLANKQDLPGAFDQIDIEDQLRIEQLVNRQKSITNVKVCTAIASKEKFLFFSKVQLDRRIRDGYYWLLRHIIHNYTFLNKRVEEDKKVEKEKNDKLMEERRKMFENEAEPEVSTSQNQISPGDGDSPIKSPNAKDFNKLKRYLKEKIDRRSGKIHPSVENQEIVEFTEEIKKKKKARKRSNSLDLSKAKWGLKIFHRLSIKRKTKKTFPSALEESEIHIIRPMTSPSRVETTRPLSSHSLPEVNGKTSKNGTTSNGHNGLIKF